MGLKAPVDPLTDGSSDELEGTQPLIPSEDGEWTEDGDEEKKGDPLQRPENDAWWKAKSSASTATTNSPESKVQLAIQESCSEEIRRHQEELKMKSPK